MAEAAGAPVIVGRTAELDAIRRLVEEPDHSPRALLVDGEAGIGKTTLWRQALQTARAEGTATLVAAPGENEASLPYAALTDLLEGIGAEAYAELSEGQAAALAAATKYAASDGGGDEYGVSRAALALVRSAAARPLLLAVDDVQWLDPASARVLEFVVRRLAELPVRILVARRTTRAETPPLGLARALPPSALEIVRLGPLDATALDELLRTQIGLRLPRPALLRLERVTEGNPYYALEIAESLAGGGGLEVPRSLTEALEIRIASLTPAAQDALLLAAACLQPSPDLVERAAGHPVGLRTALAQRLLEASGRRLRFTHPLLASVAYDRALPSERRDAHRRLSRVAAKDSEERAVHLARGHEPPDEAIAAELEATAEAAAARGGPGLAAELAEAAARLTPSEDPGGKRRRLVNASEYREAEGDPARGRELLEELIARMGPGLERAALLARLANMSDSPMEDSTRLLRQALAEAEGDASLTAEVHTLLGAFTWIAGDLERSVEHSRASVRYAEEAGDERRLAIAIGDACNSEALLGVPWDRDAMAHALEIEQRVDEIAPWERPSYQLAVISTVTDDLDTARPLVTGELERARRLGNEPGVFHLLLRVVDLELRAGDWSEALRTAREGYALARQGGLDIEEATAGTALALVLAHLGELDEARSLAEAAHRVSQDLGHSGLAIRSAGVLGFVELQNADGGRALAWLTPAREELQRMGMGELSISGVVQNEIEALVATGQLDDAEAVAAFVEEKGRRSGRSWHRAVAARGRALVASAGGDAPAARAALEEAFAAHDELPQPFERARTLLVAGAIERRAKGWAAARGRYTAALELLDDLGAARWAEIAAAELARLPGRRPRGAELTETERRIAELVAEGLANKEVAARLFVTVRTVEANLSRVYAKLGVRSRTELARKLSA